MNIGNISNKSSIYGLYDKLYEGSISLSNIKLNRNYLGSSNGMSAQTLGGDALRYITSIKAASKNLKNALGDLSGAAFAKKTPVSSDKDIMSVSYFGNRPGDIKNSTVRIFQTAAGQENTGTKLATSDTFGSSGINKFSINVGGKTTELSISISASDTNGSVQKKIADAINSSGAGVVAAVENDATTNSSLLKISSNGTGNNDNNKFTLSDITGNLVAKTGANDISSVARDAIYSVNGGPQRTSQSNTVDLGGGLNVTFNKASEKTVTISTGKDMEYAKTAVENLVKSYNDLYVEAIQRQSDAKSQNLATKMIGISKTYNSSLSRIGIGFDKDGKMTLDNSKFNEAVENGRLEQFFTENSGKNYGFTNMLSRLASNVSLNTSNYVSRSEFYSNLTENFAYSSFGSLIQYNYLSAGLIFDYSF